MTSETLKIRTYFGLLLAVIVGFAALVIVTVQGNIAKSTVSQEGLSVQLAANGVCSDLFDVNQESLLSVTVPGYDRSRLTGLRYATVRFPECFAYFR